MRSHDRTVLILTLLGVILIAIGAVISYAPSWVIAASFPLVAAPSSRTFNSWKAPSLPIYIKFYFFNVTNAEEVIENGTDPVVKETGPFTYRELRDKDEIVFNEEFTRVSFRERIVYVFDEKESGGSEDDLIVGVNIPLLTVFGVLDEMDPNLVGLARGMINGMTKMLKIKTLEPRTVGEWLWGHESEILQRMKSIPPSIGGAAIEKIKTTKFGFFLDRNGSDTHYVINTGVGDVKDIAKIWSYDGMKKLSYWGSKEANMINGTDGSMFHPGVTKDDTLEMFVGDLCRSIYATFEEKMDIQGVQSYIFSPPKEVFADVSENPFNEAFCEPKPCLGSGLLRVSNCKQDAPLVVSQPHLCDADAAVQRRVVGVSPDPKRHVTKLFVEPWTGLLIQARKRLQYNALILADDKMSATKNMRDGAIIPLFWVEEGFDADEDFSAMLRDEVLSLIQMTVYVMYFGTVVGSLLIIGAIFWKFAAIKKQKEHVTQNLPTVKMSDIKRNSVHLEQPIDYGYINEVYERKHSGADKHEKVKF